MVHIFLLCRSAIIYWIPDTVSFRLSSAGVCVCVLFSIVEFSPGITVSYLETNLILL